MASSAAELEVARKAVRRIFNPRPITEREVDNNARHLLWVFEINGFKVVPK